MEVRGRGRMSRVDRLGSEVRENGGKKMLYEEVDGGGYVTSGWVEKWKERGGRRKNGWKEEGCCG